MADNDDVQSIVIRVRETTGEETRFRIKVTTRLNTVFRAYARSKGVEMHSFRFLIEGNFVNPEDTPTSLGLEDNDVIDAILLQVGMISTFTSNNASGDPLVHYLMLTADERAQTVAPIAELRAKQSSERADRFLTYHFDANPDVLHELQRRILCALLDFVWKGTAGDYPTNRVDMRVNLNPAQLETILAPLDEILDDRYKSSVLDEKFQEIFERVPDHMGYYKIALRMTCGPTNSCINFHCDGRYATSTSQIPLNPTSEYEGGDIVFFRNDELSTVRRIPGSLVQHPPKVLHGVTSVVRGKRKSLFIVDEMNGLGEGGVIDLDQEDVRGFDTDAALTSMIYGVLRREPVSLIERYFGI